MLAFLALAHVPSLRAQAVGTITGIVTDPSGAVIPGARIAATRIETGVSQSTVTTSAGSYTIPNLVVGTYNVTAEAGGFAPGAAKGITLDVAQQRQVDLRSSDYRWNTSLFISRFRRGRSALFRI